MPAAECGDRSAVAQQQHVSLTSEPAARNSLRWQLVADRHETRGGGKSAERDLGDAQRHEYQRQHSNARCRARTVSVTHGPRMKEELPPYEMLPPHRDVLDGRQKGAANRHSWLFPWRLQALHSAVPHRIGLAVELAVKS